MNNRLSKRFLIFDISGIDLNVPIRYERYYIDNNTRIQLKGTNYEIEYLSDDNLRISKSPIEKKYFENLKNKAIKVIIRDSYLLNNYDGFSIKKYYGEYSGLVRLEIEFKTIDDMNYFIPEKWMGIDITDSPLAFDQCLFKLSKEEFLQLLSKYQNR